MNKAVLFSLLVLTPSLCIADASSTLSDESSAFAPKKKVCECACQDAAGEVQWHDDEPYTESCEDDTGAHCRYETQGTTNWGTLSCTAVFLPGNAVVE